MRPVDRLSGSVRAMTVLLLLFACTAAQEPAQDPAGATASDAARPQVTVASKAFTENIILGQILAELAQDAGADARFKRALGGTGLVFQDLTGGGTDAYVDYTGTLLQELLADQNLPDADAAREYLAGRGIVMTQPLGFNNTYALGMRRDRAAQLGIQTISDLRDHPQLRLLFNNEFLTRGDGWPAVKAAYNLPHDDVGGAEHALALQAIKAGSADVTDLYSTDAEIDAFDLVALEDDRTFFPRYDAVILYRAELDERAPRVVEAWQALVGALDEQTMIGLNSQTVVEGRNEAAVAAEFVEDQMDIRTSFVASTLASRLWRTTKEHLLLVFAAMGLGILTAVPLGILAARTLLGERLVLPAVGILQTIPSLALLALMIPLLALVNPLISTGVVPAIVALWLYSLLPMVRGTHVGLTTIPRSLKESAASLGLTEWQRLTKIELPLALPAILNGIKTSAVITVGFATLGAFINAGGYGDPILSGLRRLGSESGLRLIYEGAIPAAMLALVVQFALDGLSRLLIPRGLR